MIATIEALSRVFVLVLACAATGITASAQPPPRAAARAQIADEEIHVLNIENMKYPTDAYVGLIEGVVVVRAELNPQGGVAAASALSGPSRLVAETLANVKQWSFRPNTPMAVIVIYDYRIEGFCNGRQSHSSLRQPNVMQVRGCSQMFQP